MAWKTYLSNHDLRGEILALPNFLLIALVMLGIYVGTCLMQVDGPSLVFPDDIRGWIVFIIAIVIFAGLLFFSFFTQLLPRYQAFQMRSTLNEAQTTEMTVSISPDGYVLTTKTETTSFTWDRLYAILVTEAFVCLVDGKYSEKSPGDKQPRRAVSYKTVLIPSRAFKDEIELQQFAAAARKFQHQSKLGSRNSRWGVKHLRSLGRRKPLLSSPLRLNSQLNITDIIGRCSLDQKIPAPAQRPIINLMFN